MRCDIWTSERCDVFLGVLHLEKVTYASEGEAKIVSLWGTPAQIEKAVAVLKCGRFARKTIVSRIWARRPS